MARDLSRLRRSRSAAPLAKRSTCSKSNKCPDSCGPGLIFHRIFRFSHVNDQYRKFAHLLEVGL